MANKPLRAHPLRHAFKGGFELRGEDDSLNSTILPIFFCDQNKGDPSTRYVNPLRETGEYEGRVAEASTYPNSVINNVRVRLTISQSHDETNSRLEALLYVAGTLALSFDDVDKKNEDGSKTVGNVLRLQRETSNEDTIHPIWTGTDLTVNGNTLPSDVPALTSGQAQEVVAFDYEDYLDVMYSKILSGALKSVTMGGLKEYVTRKDTPYVTDTWYKVPSKVKRQNKGTFYGILFHLPQAGNTRQFWTTGEMTNTHDHIRINFEVEFNEYNDLFNQDA